MRHLFVLFSCLLLTRAAAAQNNSDKLLSGPDSSRSFRFVNMTDIYGKKITAKSLNGKLVVIDFWFTSCPPCLYEMPYLSKIADEYQNNKDVIFLALSTDEEKVLKDFFRTKVFNFRHIAVTRSLNDRYDVSTCPRSFVINKNGKVVFDSKGHRVAETPMLLAEALKRSL